MIIDCFLCQKVSGLDTLRAAAGAKGMKQMFTERSRREASSMSCVSSCSDHFDCTDTNICTKLMLCIACIPSLAYLMVKLTLFLTAVNCSEFLLTVSVLHGLYIEVICNGSRQADLQLFYYLVFTFNDWC